MHFIEALKLRSKLFFLLVLVVIGLVSVGIMGALNINSMKKNVDALYFGSLSPITELNEVLQTYQGSLLGTFYKARNSEINSIQTKLEIQRSLAKIDKYWKSYESHFKRNEELKYVKYVASEIKIANKYFEKIILASEDGNEFKNISMNSIEKQVLHIHKIIKKLINYEVDIAKYERKNFLDKYNSTLLEVGLVLFLITLVVIVIFVYVFKSIQNDQTKLEIATKKLKRANKKLEEVSYTDSLTSLHNRRYFNFIYDREIKRAKRAKTHITFMMLDIDFFKQYNDAYGHIEGDFALKSVAKALKDVLQRPGDFVFRLGGEEFGVLLTDTDEDSSEKLAQKICDTVRSREIKHEHSKVGEFMTISIGVVCRIADDDLDEEKLISHADKMLYQAKESGRDRYVICCGITDKEACLANIESIKKDIDEISA